MGGTRGPSRDDLFNPCPHLRGTLTPSTALEGGALGRGKAGARGRALAARQTHLQRCKGGGTSSSCLIVGLWSDGSFSAEVVGLYRKGVQTDEEDYFFLSSLWQSSLLHEIFENVFSVILLCKVRKHLLSPLNRQEQEEAKDQVMPSLFFF